VTTSQWLNRQTILVYEDAQTLAQALARRIAVLAAQAIATRGVFSIALAGGETPRRCYEILRGLPLDWARVQIYFGDERCLPRGDVQRNDSIAATTLFDHIDIPETNIHSIPAERGAVRAAADYAAALKNSLPLDVVLLGVGEDGHTASLFPGNAATASNDSVVPVFDAPKPPPERVSLGMNTLNAARHKIFLVAGAGKRDALQQIAQGADLPAAKVIGAEWHTDRAAAPIEKI
jgi:6-phosphogluconolactonase